MQAHPLSLPAARCFPAVPPLPSPAPALSDAAGLAHDAGNLLGALGLYCDLLHAPGVLRPEHRHYADELRSLSQRSSSMIRRLIRRESALRQPAAALECSAAHALRDLLPLLHSVAAPHAAVQADVPAGLPELPLPEETLERILINLVRNAAQALRDQPFQASRGLIRIAFESDWRGPVPKLVVTVADNGPGMSFATAGSFLKPLPLPQGATRGLGLRIVRELLTATCGGLTLTVQPGRGTAIRMDWDVPVREGGASC